MVNGVSSRSGLKRKPKVGIRRRERLDSSGKRAAGDSIDAVVHRQLERMHELVSERNEQTFRDLVFDFQAGLFGVGVGELALHVSQGKLKQRTGFRVRAVVRKIVECLTGKEGTGDTHNSR